jgi:hypothetical protein
LITAEVHNLEKLCGHSSKGVKFDNIKSRGKHDTPTAATWNLETISAFA